jgi:hypothetical protein
VNEDMKHQDRIPMTNATKQAPGMLNVTAVADAMQSALVQICELEAERDRLRAALDGVIPTLQLIVNGLANGSIKSKPILSFDTGESAMSLPMHSLDEIVIADLENCRAARA